MSILTIPTSTAAFQRQIVRLDGRDYLVSLTYNHRENRFYLSLADDEGAPLLSGIKLLSNWPILFRHRYNTELPPGELMVVETTTGEPPTLTELGEGKRCELQYVEAATWRELDPPRQPRPKTVLVYLALSLAELPGYAGDAAFAESLAAKCNELFGRGNTALPAAIVSAASALLAAVTGLTIGPSAPAPGPATIQGPTFTAPAGARLSFRAERINVVST